MADNRPIGLFDSGVGGLSILSQIKKVLPNENLVFFADQANIPYGQKTKKELQDLTEKITGFLLDFNIKLLVVACNTASCYAIDHLRSKFTIPIVGVVPAIKPATKLTTKLKIVVMSTPATARSDYLKSLIEEFAPNLKVLRLGCAGLEDSIENLDMPQITKLLDKYLEKVINFDADVIVLGCTHFPFVKDQIRKRIGSKTIILDSGKAVAKRVESLLAKSEKFSEEKIKDLFFTTSSPPKFSKVASALLHYEITSQKAAI